MLDFYSALHATRSEFTGKLLSNAIILSTYLKDIYSYFTDLSCVVLVDRFASMLTLFFPLQLI